MHTFLFAIAAVLIAIPLHARAQNSPPADASVGTWVGDWDSRGRYSGSMQMVVEVNGDKVIGQVKSTGTSGCSLEWEKLEGVAEGNKVFAHYNLGGRCGKVDIIYSIDRGGKVMTGSWSSQYPGYGWFRLTKQSAPSAAGAAEVAPVTGEQKQ